MAAAPYTRRQGGALPRGLLRNASVPLPCTLGTLEALTHASVDLLAEEVALLARQATNEASRSHGVNGDSVGTSTALN